MTAISLAGILPLFFFSFYFNLFPAFPGGWPLSFKCRTADMEKDGDPARTGRRAAFGWPSPRPAKGNPQEAREAKETGQADGRYRLRDPGWVPPS